MPPPPSSGDARSETRRATPQRTATATDRLARLLTCPLLAADPDTLLNLSEISLGPEIGHGAFSHVFKGTFRGQEVAVKQMKLVDRDGMKYLESELAMLKCVVAFVWRGARAQWCRRAWPTVARGAIVTAAAAPAGTSSTTT